MLTEYGTTISNFTLSGNTFSGKTFAGSTPAGSGSSEQFTLANVPRQLVVMSGPATTNITFTNNQITGTAGGVNSGGEQGNTLVTIDAANSTITGNLFAGTTTRYASALHPRRPSTTISGNTFSSSGMGVNTTHLDVENSSTPIQNVVAANTFDRGAYVDNGIYVPVSLTGGINYAASGRPRQHPGRHLCRERRGQQVRGPEWQMGQTILVPSFIRADAGGGSLGTGASSVILVQSSGVKIHDLTVNGDNPNLTSGLLVGGADVDARNGIITNHALGIYNNLEVYKTEIKNVYLRGIYASSGGTFNLHDNVVDNVQADPASIGIFNYGGSGIIARNQVSNANDAISANWSTGTQFLDNVVTHSGSGVHTDNAGWSGTADLLQGNRVSDGTTGSYGVWVFDPALAPLVTGNTVTNVDVALCASGGQPGVVTAFTNNVVDGASRLGSVGFYVTTSEFGGEMRPSPSRPGATSSTTRRRCASRKREAGLARSRSSRTT